MRRTEAFAESYNGILAGCKCQCIKENEHEENMLLVEVGIDRCSEAGSDPVSLKLTGLSG